MNIEQWLYNFNQAWTGHSIDKVLSLFTHDVEYWESPHKLLPSFDALRTEWQVIKGQTGITLRTTLYSSVDNKHTVTWTLRYFNRDNKLCLWAGTYLISLNSDGLCVYFHQTGETVATQ